MRLHRSAGREGHNLDEETADARPENSRNTRPSNHVGVVEGVIGLGRARYLLLEAREHYESGCPVNGCEGVQSDFLKGYNCLWGVHLENSDHGQGICSRTLLARQAPLDRSKWQIVDGI